MFVEFRSIIHSHWLNNTNPDDAWKQMQVTYGSLCPSRAMVFKLYKEFDNGRKTLFDLPRTGRPRILSKVNDVKKIIDEFPYSSCRYISHIVGIDHKTVKRILIEELHMKKLCLHWVPHDLTESQKVARLEISKQLLSLLQSFSENQARKVVTADESWFFLWYGADGLWTYGGIRPTNTKHKIGDEKVMFFTAFSKCGIVLIDVLPKNTTFTSEYFVTQILPQLKTSADNMTGVSRSIKLRLHMDNAKPHNSQMSQEKMKELNIERLPQPPYSPDICANDFFLYGYIKNNLKGHRFKTRDELIQAVLEIIQKIEKSTWIAVYNQWMERLQKVIDNNGDYANK